MQVSARAVLAAGVAALTGGAVALTPTVLPGSMRSIEVLRPATFTAGSSPMRPVSEDDVRSALELIGELGSMPGRGKVTVRLGGGDAAEALPAKSALGIVQQAPKVPVAAASSAPTANPVAEIADVEAVDEPIALNTASDVIDEIYSGVSYWADYLALELGPWVLDWVPLGYLVSDQIYIWYPNFVQPVSDSFVYDFLDPVVNNPLNLQVWQSGISRVLNTAATGLSNGISQEVQYILDFGWFPIPLPPIPPLAAAAPQTSFALTASEFSENAADTADDTTDSASEPESTNEDSAGNDADEAEKNAQTSVDEVTEEPVEETEKSVDEVTEAPADETPADDSGSPTEAVDESNDGEAEEALGETAGDGAVDEDSLDEDADTSDDADALDDEGADDGALDETGDASDVESGSGDEPGHDAAGGEDPGDGSSHEVTGSGADGSGDGNASGGDSDSGNTSGSD